jgi:hypothetical protein
MPYVQYVHLKRQSLFIRAIRDKPIISSERMLHKAYDHKGSVAKKKKKKPLVVILKELGAKTN